MISYLSKHWLLDIIVTGHEHVKKRYSCSKMHLFGALKLPTDKVKSSNQHLVKNGPYCQELLLQGKILLLII